MSTSIPGNPAASAPRRPGRPKTSEDPTLTAAIAATRATLLKSRAPGDTEVTQAEVDIAALALVKAGAHPHPRLVLRITGGSLVTISQKFANWLQRLALRDVDPNERSLQLPMKVGLRLQLLVAHLADAVREEVRGIPNPTEALLAAARLGEHQAMKAQIAALEAHCQKLGEALEATTFRLAKSEGEARDRAVLAIQLEAAVQRLTDALAQSTSARGAADPTMKRTLTRVRVLRETVSRPRARKRSSRARPSARSPRSSSAPRSSGSRKKRPQRRSGRRGTHG
jgi:hypothetical protein